MDYLENWKQHKEHTEEKEFIDFEAIGIKYLLEHENVFDYKIGSVYIDDKLEAFTIGNYYKQEDMVYIPVEKANPNIRGLYTFICSEFLKSSISKCSKRKQRRRYGIRRTKKVKIVI